MNVSPGETEERHMMTGLHTVADIFCVGCGSIVGWKYVRLRGNASNVMVFPFMQLLVTQMVFFRKLLMKKIRSTRKENLCLNGQ